MRIVDVGEFSLIERLKQIIATDRSDVVIGIDDDVAVLASQGDELLLATIDSQIEQVHFLSHLITPYQLGRRALAVNLSDIAAMGGYPQFALVSLILPTDTEVAWLEDVYRGLRAEADRFGVAIIGGNMARSPTGLCIDIAVLGRVRREHLLLRSGARSGDQVLVTGRLGDAAAGLKLLMESTLLMEAADCETLLAHFLTPTPRLPESAIIAQSMRATAMIDLSDGLSSDVSHICERSQVGIQIWATHLPISPATRRVAELTSIPPWQLALVGGEDYEICFTAPPHAVEKLIFAVTQATGTPVTVVGEILPIDKGRWLVLPDGSEVPLEPRGWEHFRKG